jgi:L-alanine-DL-glutamate epimerase-like enolase superfamily enzyme
VINIPKDVLEAVGESVPEHVLSRIVHDLYQRLELSVGKRIAQGLSAAQLDEFEAFTYAEDASARDWLTREVPDCKYIVAEEWASLLAWFAAAVDRQSA